MSDAVLSQGCGRGDIASSPAIRGERGFWCSAGRGLRLCMTSAEQPLTSDGWGIGGSAKTGYDWCVGW